MNIRNQYMINKETDKSNITITIIAPCYNEESNINEFYSRIIKSLNLLKIEHYQLIFVDDGSQDNSWDLIRKININDSNTVGIKLSRNFGHQNAIISTFDYIRGDYILFIDVDLQDPPELLIEMYNNIISNEYNIIYGKRIKAREGFFKKFFSKTFYFIFNLISETKIPSEVSDFKMIDQKVFKILKNLDEQEPFIRGLISWTGFKQLPIEFQRNKRMKGSSGWSKFKMINFSLSAFFGFSSFPMRISFYFCFLFIFIFFILGSYALYTYFNGINIPGWTSIFLIIIFFNIVQFFILGLISEYTGRIYYELKRRPRFIINEISKRN